MTSGREPYSLVSTMRTRLPPMLAGTSGVSFDSTESAGCLWAPGSPRPDRLHARVHVPTQSSALARTAL